MMKKLSIDTCLLLQLVSENKTLKKLGQKKYEDQVKEYYIASETQKEVIKNKIIKEYDLPNKNCPFEKVIDDYSIFLNEKLKEAKDKKRNYEEDNEYLEEDKKPTKEEYDVAVEFLERVKKLQFNKKQDRALFVKNNKQYLLGKLLLLSIKGEIELCITTSTLKETINHIKGRTNGKTKGALYREEDVADFLKNYVSYIRVEETARKKMQDFTDKFSEKTNDNTAPMKKETNSVGDVGDVNVMLETNFAGIPLATLNLKDFIWDNSPPSRWNTRIRDHINAVIKKNEDLTEALPYTIEDIVDGEFYQPERASELVLLTHLDGKNIDIDFEFKDGYEMGAN